MNFPLQDGEPALLSYDTSNEAALFMDVAFISLIHSCWPNGVTVIRKPYHPMLAGFQERFRRDAYGKWPQTTMNSKTGLAKDDVRGDHRDVQRSRNWSLEVDEVQVCIIFGILQGCFACNMRLSQFELKAFPSERKEAVAPMLTTTVLYRFLGA